MTNEQYEELRQELIELREEIRLLGEKEPENNTVVVPATVSPGPTTTVVDPATTQLISDLRKEVGVLTATVQGLKNERGDKREEIGRLRDNINELNRQLAQLQGKIDAYNRVANMPAPVATPAPTPAPRIIYTTPPPAPTPEPRIIYTTPPPAPTPAPRIVYTTPPPVPTPEPRVIVTEPTTTRRIVEEPRRIIESEFDRMLRENRVTSIYFGLNSTTISAEEKRKMDGVGRILADYPEAFVRINGFTDRSGSAAYNLTLSKKRAETVKNHLINVFGVLPYKIDIFSLGEVEGDGPEKDPTARRVDIELYER